jgi:hypothetical protein
MPVVNTIQLRRDSLANWTSVNPTLAAGEVGYDSTSNKIKIGDGTTAWNSLEYASGGASILVSATEPDDPEVGDVWFNTESGITYVYYDSSWVSVAGSSGAPIISDTAPADPVLGTQWFNSSTGKSYLYYSNAWVEIDSNGTSTLSTGNLVINGAFDFWQRGTSFTADGAFTADRWVMALSGATATTSRQSFTAGQTDVPENPSYFLRFAVSTGDNAARIEQRLENVTLSSGNTYTLSFWAKGTNPGGGVIEVVGRQEFGTGGSAGAIVSAGNITLTGSWQRFTKTFTYASVAGKTITSSNQFWGFDIRQPGSDTSTAAWTLDLANVQLEAGAVATPFRRNAPSIQAELAACQRYYYAPSTNTAGAAFVVPTGTVNTISFPVQMRTNPTMTYTPANIVISNNGIDRTATGAANALVSPNSVIFSATVAGLTAGNGCLVFFTSGSAITASAEL